MQRDDEDKRYRVSWPACFGWKRYLCFLCSMLLVFLSTGLPSQDIRAYSFLDANYYHQLNTAQKQIYDCLADLRYTDKPLDLTFLANGIRLTTPDTNLTSAQQKEMTKEIQENLQVALDAFLKDYPDCFWLDVANSKCNYRFAGSGSAGQIRWTITEVKYNFVVKSSYQSNVASVESDLRQAIQDFPVSGRTRYDKLKSIHDALANRVTYKETGEKSHDAVGALLNGKAVCEGYAKAVKLLCDRYNIPCVLVVGDAYDSRTDSNPEPHMWNYIKMEDGKWYAMDATWGDQSWGISYDFFLVGAQTVSDGYGGLSFAESHKPDGDFSETDMKDFCYPALSDSAYVPDSGTAEPKTTATPAPSPTAKPSEKPTDAPSATPTKAPATTATPKPTEALQRPSETPAGATPSVSPILTEAPSKTAIPNSSAPVGTNDALPQRTEPVSSAHTPGVTDAPSSSSGPSVSPSSSEAPPLILWFAGGAAALVAGAAIMTVILRKRVH